MFWALNGATLYPSWANSRQSPATMRLLPTDDPVPWIMTTLASLCLFMAVIDPRSLMPENERKHI